jgi:hypothetical protein
MPPTVEMPLNGLERLDHTFKLLVSCEDDESGVGLGALRPIRIDWQTARGENLVILFANFPVPRGYTVSI